MIIRMIAVQMYGCRVAFFVTILSTSVVMAESNRMFLLSRNARGESGDQNSFSKCISTTGRAVGIDSEATNLLETDDNKVRDVFSSEWPFTHCHIESLNWRGQPANKRSLWAQGLSVDGRYLAFTSDADDLIEGDTNGCNDVFLRDRSVGRTRLLGTNADGEQADLGTYQPTLTPDGRFASFASGARNLVKKDRSGIGDVFVKDLSTGEVFLVSVASDGTQGDRDSGGEDPSSMSADGRFVAFSSFASNLVPYDYDTQLDVFVHDRDSHTTVRVSVDAFGEGAGVNSHLGGISADGRLVVFDCPTGLWWNDYNETTDVYLRDMETEETWLVSVNSDWIPVEDGASGGAISASGRYVVFSSYSDNLDERCGECKEQIYVRDLLRETTTLVSVNDSGEPANDYCQFPQISGNGRFITFASFATNLVDVDTNGVQQVYVVDFLGCSEHIRGDSNCDGTVDLADIDAFILALIDEGEYVLQNLSCDWECNNDINGDRTVDFNDIDGFVECLINGACE